MQNSRKCRILRGKAPRKENPEFTFNSCIREKHAKQIYAVEFNPFLKENQPNIFASVGKNYVSIYECVADKAGTIKCLQRYADPNEEEDYYTCCWSIDKTSKLSILLAGGACGIIRIFYPKYSRWNKHFIGHGAAINELKVPLKQPFLLASASKDNSIRLWNIQTNVCVACFHSNDTHRDQVVSIDFNHDCTQLVSGGNDHKLIIWNLNVSEIQSAIKASNTYNRATAEASFKTVYHPFTAFSSRDVHKNYIDCVSWFGDFIISKACEDDLICWKPGFFEKPDEVRKETKSTCSILHKFDVTDCTYFFMRFALNRNKTALALGNNSGMVKVWNLNVPEPGMIRAQKLTHPKCNSVIRHLSFSQCGRILIFCCDDASIWRFQRN